MFAQWKAKGETERLRLQCIYGDPPTMTDWYYRLDHGKENGPLPSSKLLELIRSGVIKSDTEIRKDRSAWVPAAEINGLWKAAGLPSVSFQCPYCQSRIEKPPTRCHHCERDISKAVGHLVQNSPPVDKGWEQKNGSTKKPKAPPLQG